MKLHICDNCKKSLKTKKITLVHTGEKEKLDWCKECRKALYREEFGKLADRRGGYNPTRSYTADSSYIEYR